MSAMSAAVIALALERSSTLKDSRMLWRRAGGIWVSGSPLVARVNGDRRGACVFVDMVAEAREGVG